MKVLIDINHPAHVHYFRNFAKIMMNKGHKILFTSRNKEIEHYLLKFYNLEYIDRGKGKNSIIGKLLYMFRADKILLDVSRSFKPDLLLSFGSIYAAQVSKIINKPHIAFDDTEHSKYQNFLYSIFSNVILSPSCFIGNINKRQLFFDSYMELCYLHPNYFKPDKSILKYLGVKENEKYVIFRFVAWNAAHDIGHTGLSLDIKRKAVKELSKYATVFISSEKELPNELKKYQIKIPPEKMHDALAFSTLLYGESSTMASECACLGVSSIYHDNDGRGYTDEEESKYHLVYNYSESRKDQELALKKAIELVQYTKLQQENQIKHSKLITDKIDVTEFMVWFIENYPQSAKIMKENPDYQNRFK